MSEEPQVEQMLQQMLDGAVAIARPDLPVGASRSCECGQLATCVVEYFCDGVIVAWRVSCDEHRETAPRALFA